MLCTYRDGYLKKLIQTDLMISWKIELTNNITVYGDYDRPDYDNPWSRLQKYCEQNNTVPKKVELHMFGTPKKIFFENENGLDGVFVMRGIAKDQAMDGSHSASFQTLTVGLLREDCSCIDTIKYTWPHNQFEQENHTRSLTQENINYMIFKNEGKKQHPEVQKYLNRTTM